MMMDSESRMVRKTVGPYLLEIRLARIIGYFLPVSKDPILIDWHEVASSNFLLVPSARNLIFIVAKLALMTSEGSCNDVRS